MSMAEGVAPSIIPDSVDASAAKVDSSKRVSICDPTPRMTSWGPTVAQSECSDKSNRSHCLEQVRSIWVVRNHTWVLSCMVGCLVAFVLLSSPDIDSGLLAFAPVLASLVAWTTLIGWRSAEDVWLGFDKEVRDDRKAVGFFIVSLSGGATCAACCAAVCFLRTSIPGIE